MIKIWMGKEKAKSTVIGCGTIKGSQEEIIYKYVRKLEKVDLAH